MQSYPSAQCSPNKLTHEPMHQTHSFYLNTTIAFQMLSCLAEKALMATEFTVHTRWLLQDYFP